MFFFRQYRKNNHKNLAEKIKIDKNINLNTTVSKMRIKINLTILIISSWPSYFIGKIIL